jgi:hypothetical protein
VFPAKPTEVKDYDLWKKEKEEKNKLMWAGEKQHSRAKS